MPALRLQHLDVVVGDEYDDQPRPVHRDLVRTDLVRERVRLVLPLDHPLAKRRKVPLAGLGAQPWAACQPGTGHREMQIRTCRQLGGFEPDLRYASDDFLILLELVRTTGACALLPELVLGYDAPGVVVRDLAEGAIGRSVFLLTRSTRTPAVRARHRGARGARRPASEVADDRVVGFAVELGVLAGERLAALLEAHRLDERSDVGGRSR